MSYYLIMLMATEDTWHFNISQVSKTDRLMYVLSIYFLLKVLFIIKLYKPHPNVSNYNRKVSGATGVMYTLKHVTHFRKWSVFLIIY